MDLRKFSSPLEKSQTSKTSETMPKSSSTQPTTSDGHDDASIETKNGKPEAAHNKQQKSQRNEIADEIRACCQVVDEFDVVFKKLWTLSGKRSTTESYPWQTDDQSLLLSIKDELTKKVAMKLHQLAYKL
jgi:hypothetical protein